MSRSIVRAIWNMDYFCADRAGIRKAEQYTDSGKTGQKKKECR